MSARTRSRSAAWTGSAKQAQREYGWDEQADSAKFVVAYPDGVGGSWNADGCCGQASKDNVDDVGFIIAAVRDIAEKLDIDKTRIYAAGISNGGIMAYKLACNTDLFAAIGTSTAPTTAWSATTGNLGPRCRSRPRQRPTSVRSGAMSITANLRTTVDGDLTTSVAGCPSGRSVELITVAGGGHDWPSFATERMWDFFAAHPGRRA